MSRNGIHRNGRPMRTAWSIVMCAVVLLGMWAATPVLAAEDGTEGQADVSAESLSLSLADAVDLAFENNVELSLEALSVETTRTGLAQVRALNLMESSPTLLLQAESGLELAKRNLALSEQRIAFEVEEAYYDVLRLQNVLLVLDDALKMSERQLEVAE